jgi:hypothetical protein
MSTGTVLLITATRTLGKYPATPQFQSDAVLLIAATKRNWSRHNGSAVSIRCGFVDAATAGRRVTGQGSLFQSDAVLLIAATLLNLFIARSAKFQSDAVLLIAATHRVQLHDQHWSAGFNPMRFCWSLRRQSQKQLSAAKFQSDAVLLIAATVPQISGLWPAALQDHAPTFVRAILKIVCCRSLDEWKHRSEEVLGCAPTSQRWEIARSFLYPVDAQGLAAG